MKSIIQKTPYLNKGKRISSVQLTQGSCASVTSSAIQAVSYTDQLDHLGMCALQKGASQVLVSYAQRQTRKYVAVCNSQNLSAHDRKRITAYFWAIVKRKAVTRNDSHEINQRVVLNTFVKTLQNQGRSSEDIADQLIKNYAEYAPQTIIDEYLTSLMTIA